MENLIAKFAERCNVFGVMSVILTILAMNGRTEITFQILESLI